MRLVLALALVAGCAGEVEHSPVVDTVERSLGSMTVQIGRPAVVLGVDETRRRLAEYVNGAVAKGEMTFGEGAKLIAAQEDVFKSARLVRFENGPWLVDSWNVAPLIEGGASPEQIRQHLLNNSSSWRLHLARAGIKPSEPSEWSEMVRRGETLKAQGATPIRLGFGDD